MHYDARNSFGIDWTKDTMIPLSPGVEIKKLDNRLSDIDISKLRTAYKCGVPLSTTTASTATTRITTTTTTSTTVLTSFQRLVSSISSKSAGAATRVNLDEYIDNTELAILEFSKAKRSKVILILNPAEPPVNMQTSISF